MSLLKSFYGYGVIVGQKGLFVNMDIYYNNNNTKKLLIYLFTRRVAYVITCFYISQYVK